MLIMVYIAYSKHKGVNSTLLRVFYRDGVYYFACLSGTHFVLMLHVLINVLIVCRFGDNEQYYELCRANSVQVCRHPVSRGPPHTPYPPNLRLPQTRDRPPCHPRHPHAPAPPRSL